MSQTNAGFHHVQIGDITVTALNDGLFEASTGYLAGIEPAEAERLIGERFRVLPPVFTVNAFLIRSGTHLALVDAGAPTAMAPGVGRLPQRLAAIGVRPDAITTLLLTHLHGDHIGMLTDEAGAATFPNAKLLLSEAEAGFWLDEAIAAKAPDAAKPSFAFAQKATAPYRERMHLAAKGDVLPGVSIVPLPGHTPGHSGYLVSSGGQSLLIWGDIVHVPALQFARPEIGLVFDSDQAEARATREHAFDMAATDRMLVAGMHHEFPAFGHVVRHGAGYGFEPAMWLAE